MYVSKHKTLGISVYWLFAMIYWEVLAHAGMYEGFHRTFGFALGFGAAIGLVIAALVSLLPRKAIFPVNIVLTLVLAVLYGSQMVYCFIFGTPYSVSQMGMGGDAITSFWKELVATMQNNILWILALMLPLAVLIGLKYIHALHRPGWGHRAVLAAAALVLAAGTFCAIRLGGTEMYSDYYFFTSTRSTTTQTMERFGVPMTFWLEMTHTEDPEDDVLLAVVPMMTPVVPAETKATEPSVETTVPTEAATIPETVPTETTLPETVPTETAPVETTAPDLEHAAVLTNLSDTEETTEEITEPAAEPVEETTEAPTEAVEEETVPAPILYNVLDIDFDALSASTENTRLQALNSYCAQMPATNQNAYTGMLKDYNLIVLCAESYSPAAVDPVLTPTLYKMTHEGFLFKNYYNSYPNTTIDGEYSLCQGLFPDAIRGKEDSSMLASATHKLPFTIANIFAEQLNVPSYGYHNNYATYYGRDQAYPAMGYTTTKFTGRGMTFTEAWPSSDLEMMEQSMEDYIHEPQFHAYYMTFSGHYLYDTATNGIAARNFHLVKDLPDYCMEQKAYLACHIELDRALEYMLKRLEEEGIADKTVIVLAADHFPYGLTKKMYFEMLNQEQDFFASYKSDLIFWVGGMEEPVEVDTYCCNVDILPTILNLWGIRYDSRLLAGTDIFSEGPHTAILIDHSFLTDQVWFNSNTGETRYLVPESELPEGYVNTMNQFVASRFDFSTQVLRNNYYQFVFGK